MFRRLLKPIVVPFLGITIMQSMVVMGGGGLFMMLAMLLIPHPLVGLLLATGGISLLWWKLYSLHQKNPDYWAVIGSKWRMNGVKIFDRRPKRYVV